MSHTFPITVSLLALLGLAGCQDRTTTEPVSANEQRPAANESATPAPIPAQDQPAPAAPSTAPDTAAPAPAPGQRPIDADGDVVPPENEEDAVPADRDDATATAGSRVPARFIGRWDSSRAACRGTRGEMRLRVERDRLVFYESVATVTGVERLGGGAVTLDLTGSGEGETWRERRTLTLADNGRRLTVAARGSTADRVRCD